MNASSRGSASETAPVSHPNFWKTWTSPPNANLARLTLGVFPLALASDFGDWATHLAAAPGKHQQLVRKTVFKNMRFARYVLQWLYELATFAQLPRAEELPDRWACVHPGWANDGMATVRRSSDFSIEPVIQYPADIYLVRLGFAHAKGEEHVNIIYRDSYLVK